MRISDWSSDVCSSDLRRGGCIRDAASHLERVRSSWKHAPPSAPVRRGRQPPQENSMALLSRPLRHTLAAALALAAAPAFAQGDSPYSNTVFFGDSLTDAGYFRPVLLQVVGPSGALIGKFTTNPGLVWSEYLAQYYGTDASPNGNGQNGDNYAAGGARVGVDTVGGLGPIPSLRSEEHTSELQSLMRISYAVFGLKKQ